jgi:hypothetical protein
MFNKSKYVVGNVSSLTGSITVAIVFPEIIGHDDVARLFIPNTIVGAGFCHVQDDTVSVYGSSAKLQIDSRSADLMYVEQALSLVSDNNGL